MAAYPVSFNNHDANFFGTYPVSFNNHDCNRCYFLFVCFGCSRLALNRIAWLSSNVTAEVSTQRNTAVDDAKANSSRSKSPGAKAILPQGRATLRRRRVKHLIGSKYASTFFHEKVCREKVVLFTHLRVFCFRMRLC